MFIIMYYYDFIIIIYLDVFILLRGRMTQVTMHYKICLDIREQDVTMKVVWRWQRLPREAVEPQSLETFRI